MRQETLTVALKVRDVGRLSQSLQALAHDRVGQGRLAQPRVFAGGDIHFARLVLIDEPVTSPYASWLVLESNFDTEHESTKTARASHVEQLVSTRGEELHRAFSACQGVSSSYAPADLVRALLSGLVEATAAYQGHMHRDLARIRLEREVRREALRAGAMMRAEKSPHEVLAGVRDHVKSIVRMEPDRFLGLDLDAPAPALPSPVRREKQLRAGLGPWLINSWLALPLVPLLPFVAYYDLTDDHYDVQRESESLGPEGLRRLDADARSEGFATQNPLTHIVPLRSGLARGAIMRFAHAYIRRMASAHFNYTEQLGGIPTIHFAKWLKLDGGKRLLFFSNYDGSWESYLGDFVDRAAAGLNLAWCCTELYPKTQWLLNGGADDEERFKAWGRAYQRPTQVFYTAYPEQSVADVNNNTWLRHGLHESTEVDAEAWKRRLT